MPWIEPKVDWNNSNVPVASDFNRIEGNTKDLKDLKDSKLDNNGDGKEVVVTFAAGTDTEIASGQTLATIFGKLLTKLRNINTAITNIINGTTIVAKATDANTLDGNDSTAYSPTSHASTGTTYGVGTTANYGHCKTINNLTQSSHVDGTALSAYQGYVLNNLLNSYRPTPLKISGQVTGTQLVEIINFDVVTKNYSRVLIDWETNRSDTYMIDIGIANIGGIVTIATDTDKSGHTLVTLTTNYKFIAGSPGEWPQIHAKKVGNNIYLAMRSERADSTDSYSMIVI